MSYITFDNSRPYDLVLLGRVAVDFNPVDYFQPLEECTTFKKYVGGSPANIAVGAARHGLKVGFFARVSDDQLGDFVTHFFQKEGIDTSRIRRCENGEKIGLAFTEILSRDESSILMYRNCIADLQLHPDDIDEEYIKNTKMLLISGTSLAASPSREAALKAVMLAKRCGTKVIFDVDYRSYSWKNKDEISVFNRNLSLQAIKKAVAITSMSFIIMSLSTVLIMASANAPALDILYETVSATATVGLSRNLTPFLNIFGKIVIILTMYFGRIGPISLFIAFGAKKPIVNSIKNPIEEISVG